MEVAQITEETIVKINQIEILTNSRTNTTET